MRPQIDLLIKSNEGNSIFLQALPQRHCSHILLFVVRNLLLSKGIDVALILKGFKVLNLRVVAGLIYGGQFHRKGLKEGSVIISGETMNNDDWDSYYRLPCDITVFEVKDHYQENLHSIYLSFFMLIFV